MCAVTGKCIRGWRESVTGCPPCPPRCSASARGLGQESKRGNMPPVLSLGLANPACSNLQVRSCLSAAQILPCPTRGSACSPAGASPGISPLFQASSGQAAAGLVLLRSAFSGRGPCFLPGPSLILDNGPSVCEDTHVSSGSRPPASRAWAALPLPADSRGQPGQSPTAEGTARNQPFLLYVRALTQRHGNIWVGPSLE